MGTWKLNVGVNLDHHSEYDHRYYSVPCELINARVDVRATATVIEVWHNNARVTSHVRSYGPRGTAVTKEEHRPRAHREWGAWPAERLVGWAKTKGSKTAEVVTAILERGAHPESGRRACLGLMRLGERHGDERLEAACGRALAISNPTYRSVQAILKSGLEKVAHAEDAPVKMVVHENIRGGAYFDRHEGSPSEAEDDTEARYLEEERLAIILDSDREPPRGNPVIEELKDPAIEAQSGEVSDGVERGAYAPPPGAATEPIAALIGRLQALLTGPRFVDG